MRPSQSVYKDGHTYRNAFHLKLTEALVAKARERNQDLNWEETERLMMLALVNERRTELRKKPVEIGDVRRVEQQALGHADYGHKFALYCTELAEDEL